jgi:hypothetical protein
MSKQLTSGLLLLLVQDFLVMDRGLPADLSAQYGGLAQMPLAGQAQVIAYNISALNSTDPNIVRTYLLLGLKRS